MEEDPWVFVGSRIKGRRLDAGISAKELATSANITSEQLAMFESDSTGMSPELLTKIGQILDVDFQYFFENLPLDQPELRQQRLVRGESLETLPPRTQ